MMTFNPIEYIKAPVIYMYSVYKWSKSIDSHKMFLCGVVQEAMLICILLLYVLTGNSRELGIVIISLAIFISLVFNYILMGVPTNVDDLKYCIFGSKHRQQQPAQTQNVMTQQKQVLTAQQPMTQQQQQVPHQPMQVQYVELQQEEQDLTESEYNSINSKINIQINNCAVNRNVEIPDTLECDLESALVEDDVVEVAPATVEAPKIVESNYSEYTDEDCFEELVADESQIQFDDFEMEDELIKSKKDYSMQNDIAKKLESSKGTMLSGISDDEEI